MTVERIDVRDGYDLWSRSYDEMSNPLVAMDRRVTMSWLAPRSGERLLDAACGTGAHLAEMARRGSRPVGIDVSRGMLSVARAKVPHVPLVQANLEAALPLRPASFDGCLCALVGEHIGRLGDLFAGLAAVIRPGGRLVFSTFHPELAAAGVEPNFERDGTEYRMSAARHTLDDYLGAIRAAGFERIECADYAGDEELVREVPAARKYLGRALLAVVRAWRQRR
jgi:SAM-dependent methyltransferase